ncbi:hypothetical protein ABW19_dt0206079 [Dactylella cylindrospora]|nr:hypothetical protein ABW19_dt0206079 [Dactylella cylindrospora]
MKSYGGLLSDLQEYSEMSQSLRDNFVHIAGRRSINVVCFYELRETMVFKSSWLFELILWILGFLGLRWLALNLNRSMVVQKNSASIDNCDLIALNADHSGMNKFLDHTDPNYQLVQQELNKLVSNRRTVLTEDQKNNLSKLGPRRAKGATFASLAGGDRPGCLPGTRTDLLDRISSWVDSPGSKPIFWLQGMAGTGKSTISRTVAKLYSAEQREQLGASFFFNRYEDDRNNASKFCTTIATDLMEHLHPLKFYISQAIEKKPYILEAPWEEQFENLVCEPFLRARFVKSKVVIVIDALDECQMGYKYKGIRHLLADLARLRANDIEFRIFVTSRPEPEVRSGFKSISEELHEDIALHVVQEQTIQHDITVLFKYTFQNILKNHPVQHFNKSRRISSSWPGEDTLAALVNLTTPLFISAATICKFISFERTDPRDRLQTILESGTTSTGEVNEIYWTILDQSVKYLHDGDFGDGATILKYFRDIIGTVALLESPLSLESLTALLSEISSSTMWAIFEGLHSVLNIPDDDTVPILIYHLSFREFLLSSKAGKFQIDDLEMHWQLARRCVAILDKYLQPDICRIKIPGALRSDINIINESVLQKWLPPHVQYACRYWIRHLEQSKHALEDGGMFHRFIQAHLLHWLEASSFMGDMSQASHQIDGDEFPMFLHAAKNFIQQNQEIVNEAPLQLYSSVLIFAPEDNLIRKSFLHYLPEWARMLQTVPKSRSALIRAFELPTGFSEAACLSFSSNGKELTSIYARCGVITWDVASGTVVGSVELAEEGITALVLAKDNKRVAFKSSNDKITLISMTPKIISKIARTGIYEPMSLCFSLNSTMLASVCKSQTHYYAKLWDAETGGLIQGHFARCKGGIKLAFSPDNRVLAIAPLISRPIEFWDIVAGKVVNTFPRYHDHRVNVVSFSPDNQIFAVGLSDGTLQLWEPSSGLALGELRMYDSSLVLQETTPVIAFSVNSKRRLLACAPCDGTIQLWDITTIDKLTNICQFRGHSKLVASFAFSPDGKLLASGSTDRMIKLWDVDYMAEKQEIGSHTKSVQSLAFSPDGRFLASSSEDTTINLWSISSGGRPPRTLRGHTKAVLCVAFSSDGKLLASGSADMTLQIWNTVDEEEPPRTFKNLRDCATSVAFSSDGDILAVASILGTVELRDLSSDGTIFRTIIDNIRAPVRMISFPPDRPHTVCTSRDGNLFILWDIRDGSRVQTFKHRLLRVPSWLPRPDHQKPEDLRISPYCK